MDITASPLFRDTLDKAIELRDQFLVPSYDLLPEYGGLDSVKTGRFYVPDPRDFSRYPPDGPQLPGMYDPARRQAEERYRQELNEAAFELAKHYRLRIRPALLVRLGLNADHTLIDSLDDNERWRTTRMHDVKNETLRERCEAFLSVVLSLEQITIVRMAQGLIVVTIPAEAKAPQDFHTQINAFRKSGTTTNSIEVKRHGLTNDWYHNQCTLWGRKRADVANEMARESKKADKDWESAIDTGLSRYKDEWEEEAGGPNLPNLRCATSFKS